MVYTDCVSSPLGVYQIKADHDALLSVQLVKTVQPTHRNDVVRATSAQLAEYFQGQRQDFTVPIKPMGTEFQQTVWAALQTIPYGVVTSYGEIAKQVGNPLAARAIGLANNKNPIAIIIPCHRVVGASGKLTGYRGGLDKKAWLLHHEGQHAN